MTVALRLDDNSKNMAPWMLSENRKLAAKKLQGYIFRSQPYTNKLLKSNVQKI